MKSYFDFSNPYFNYSYYSQYKKEREDYYSQFINEENLSSLFTLFDNTADKAFKTDTEIGIQELPFDSSTFKILLKKGLPSYKKAKKYNKVNHEIRVYRNNFYKCSMQINLHFINNNLLYIHYCFLYADTELQKMIYQLLEEKYRCRLSFFPELEIKDSLDNCIKVSVGMHLNLHYLYGNKNHLKLIKGELNRKECLKEKKYLNRRNSIGKLI